ncbi:hypothetical protein SLA2020_264920 [Shorea laevis]
MMSIAYAMVPASLLRAQRELAPTSLHTQATSLLGRGGVKEGLEPSDLSPPFSLDLRVLLLSTEPSPVAYCLQQSCLPDASHGNKDRVMGILGVTSFWV